MDEPAEAASSPCSAREADFGFVTSLRGVAALVLAGGEGRRMGGAKPHRMLGGRRLLDFALDIARRHGGPVAIGVRVSGQVADLGGVEEIIDAPGIGGPLASLAAGLDWADRIGARYVLTLPCDAPLLPRDLASRLLRRLQQDAVLAAVPQCKGQLHPACALWDAELKRQLQAYLSSGRRALIGFAEQAGFAVEDWDAPDRDPFFNINTPDDLALAEKLFSQPHLE